MTTYLFRCGDCGGAFESAEFERTLPTCRRPGCPGTPERVSGVAFHVFPVDDVEAAVPDARR